MSTFPVVLRAAIAASGLPLERIRYRLGLADVHVSVPTLSNWQSGRRTPERRESRRAVAELERVLALPAGALVSLLGPPRARGRTVTPSPPTATWGRAGARLLSTLDTVADGRLLRLSQHDTVTVDAAGKITEVHTRHVFRAGQDGAHRWIDVWHHGAAQAPAVLTGRWRCLPGQVRIDRRARLAAAELMLDAALPAGATAVAEYGLAFDDGPAGRFFRRFALPVREYVLEMRFAPAATVRCRRGRSVLTPSPSGVVTVAEPDVTGLVDVTWDYGAV